MRPLLQEAFPISYPLKCMRLTSYWPWICTLPRLTGHDLLGAVIELSLVCELHEGRNWDWLGHHCHDLSDKPTMITMTNTVPVADMCLDYIIFTTLQVGTIISLSQIRKLRLRMMSLTQGHKANKSG